MPLLGNIFKQAVNLAGSLRENDEHSYQASQIQTLKELLAKAAGTRFGRDHDFASLVKLDDPRAAFQAGMRPYDYHRMAAEYWEALHAGDSDVSWPGRPEYFALTSGTTGNRPKRLPVTVDLLDSIREAGVRQLLSLKNFDIPPEVYEKQVLMLGSSTDLQNTQGLPEGEISGISASRLPGWFDNFYKPGKDIAAIHDWDQRLAEIVERAPEWDIGALSGIPSWIQLMLERIIEAHGLKNIHELWPSLSIYTTGGVAFEPYRSSFEQLLDRPLTYMDTYLASEGFFGYNARPETDAMQLVLDNGVYYEFLPFGPDYFDNDGLPHEDAPSVPIDQLEEGKDYALLISTCAGAWRYLIGDTIAFSNLDLLEFRITGRTQGFLNVVGSQLSEQKLNVAIQHLEESSGVSIREYTVGAEKVEGKWWHRWFLGAESELDPGQAAQILDEHLRARNKNYDVARDKALRGVQAEVVSPEAFYTYQEKRKKKGGQVKMPRVLLGEKWEDWVEFVRESQ